MMTTMIKVTPLRNTKSKCFACSTNAIVKVDQGFDSKKICSYHTGLMPKDIRDAIDARLNPPTPVAEPELATATA
jgi:hypothetical protein